jgi:hypothetical protein
MQAESRRCWELAGDPEVRDPVAAGAALLGSDIAVEHRHRLALRVVADDHASYRFGFHLNPPVIVSEHDPEKACPGLDLGWKPVFRKGHAPPKKVKGANRFNLKRLGF